jgi:hypothetical protein
MSDMKKIKTKLVTFVTDTVLLVGIVGNENLRARVLQERSGKVASKEETKKVAMRRQQGNSADLRRSAKIGVEDLAADIPVKVSAEWNIMSSGST